ncbi:MAG: K(+)-transporting ATPase subunit C, partial [Acidimicrobiia bacterium]
VVAFTVITGVAYPAAVSGAARLFFDDQADGSRIWRDGTVVGSSLIGQPFGAARYFHLRPSAAGDGYDASASAGSNLGPTNDVFMDEVADRVAAYLRENRLPADVPVPVDAVTASASGLDPHISPANARLQAPRVARARHLPTEQVLVLVEDHTDRRALGFLGEPGVNVLELNLALDDLDA